MDDWRRLARGRRRLARLARNERLALAGAGFVAGLASQYSKKLSMAHVRGCGKRMLTRLVSSDCVDWSWASAYRTGKYSILCRHLAISVSRMLSRGAGQA